MEELRESTPETAKLETSYLKYTFFKVVREWRSLGEGTKEESRIEFLKVLGDFPSLSLSFFSLVGFRGDTDFMIVAEASSLDPFQTLVSKLFSTKLGRYLEIPYSYLAMTRKSRYLGSHRHTGQEGKTREHRSNKFLFVYPFVKKREWYRLPFAERQRIMAEHFKIGHKYPSIKINTGYSFGLDDQEFVLAFDGNDPAEFLSLVEDLRSSEASMYTQLETPIFTCRRVDPNTMLSLLG
jgi:chlorite dismutase